VQHIIFDDGEDVSSSESEDELEEVKAGGMGELGYAGLTD